MTSLISICVATYKRPQGLTALLQGIKALTFAKVDRPHVEVVIVDNDSTASARKICEDAKADFPWTLIYEVEPQQGVSYARNRAIACASSSSDFIVFIDDDEAPQPQWLDELLHAQGVHNADVVTGPVYPIFEAAEVPKWIHSGGFFNPPDREDGSVVHIAYTHNVLVKAELLRQNKAAFDNDFAFRGAEDVHLFMKLSKEGAKFIWAREAAVYEIIPPQRTNIKWILDRNYYGWSSHSLLDKRFFPSLTRQLVRLVKGTVLAFLGIILLIPGFLAGRSYGVKALVYIYRGAGTISGLLNVQGAWGGANR